MIVTLSEVAIPEFHALPAKIRVRVAQILERLKLWPDVSGAKSLRGNLKGQYRIRTGDYRVQFIVGKTEIIVVRVGHRDGFYEENMPRKISFKKLAERYDAVQIAKWSIGCTIRESRIQSRMTVLELAHRVGVRAAVIERLERGTGKIDVRLTDRIIDVVGAA
jgi:mRNA-degrading endonuclease RelE of RelBE toxin-antitoxin system/DNA-binding XRE family transcriptional regulator